MKYVVSYLHSIADDWYDKSPCDTIEQAKELAESLKDEHEIVLVRAFTPVLLRYDGGTLLENNIDKREERVT